MSPGTERMFICNSQRHRTNALFSFQLNSAEMNLAFFTLNPSSSSFDSLSRGFGALKGCSWMEMLSGITHFYLPDVAGWHQPGLSQLYGLFPHFCFPHTFFFLFFFFYVPCIFCAMPCCLICMIHFIPIFMPLLHWTGSFQGLAHFSEGETTRMKWQVNLFVTLFSGNVRRPTHSSSSPTPRLQVTEQHLYYFYSVSNRINQPDGTFVVLSSTLCSFMWILETPGCWQP